MAENTPWIWHSATQLPMTSDPFDPDPESEPKKLQIIIPVISIVIIILIAIGILCWYRKRKRKAQNQTFEAPETKIRLSLLGTQYQISNEISRKSSSEESTEFREKALVDSELEQTDNESPMQYMVLPPENQSKHGSTYLYLHDNQQSRRSTRSSQDFSMSDIVNISSGFPIYLTIFNLSFLFKGRFIKIKSTFGIRRFPRFPNETKKYFSRYSCSPR